MINTFRRTFRGIRQGTSRPHQGPHRTLNRTRVNFNRRPLIGQPMWEGFNVMYNSFEPPYWQLEGRYTITPPVLPR